MEGPVEKTSDVRACWEANAPTWVELARGGYDIFRDYINTPAFMQMLPDVRGRFGLDIGCGEGHNTRLLARRGARMAAVDLAWPFVAAAAASERAEPLGIRYHHASAVALPFADAAFDFATSFMCLMDTGDVDSAVREAYRVIRPGGFFQFSITHPCFQTPKWKWMRDENGRRSGVICGDYFNQAPGRMTHWTFGALPANQRAEYPEFSIPVFDRTLSSRMNLLTRTGLVIQEMCEPMPDDAALAARPELYHSRIVAFFLTVRCGKPA